MELYPRAIEYAMFFIVCAIFFSYFYGVDAGALPYVQGAGLIIMLPLKIIEILAGSFGLFGPMVTLLAAMAFFKVLGVALGEATYITVLALTVIFLTT